VVSGDGPALQELNVLYVVCVRLTVVSQVV
jgi:hypothetical protein